MFIIPIILSLLLSFCGDKFWDEVPDEDKEAFRQAASEASDYAWDLYIEQLESDKQFMIDNGLTVTELTEEDRERMIEMIHRSMTILTVSMIGRQM